MTFKRNKATDLMNTKALLSNPAMQASQRNVKPNWLGHSKGNAGIDYELLNGTTMAKMLQYRGAVREHLAHLEKEHGLVVENQNGVFKFKP